MADYRDLYFIFTISKFFKRGLIFGLTSFGAASMTTRVTKRANKGVVHHMLSLLWLITALWQLQNSGRIYIQKLYDARMKRGEPSRKQVLVGGDEKHLFA